MSQPKKTLKQRLQGMFGKRFRAGGYSAAASAIVIAIAVLLNLMVGSLPTTTTQIDLTDQAIYSLSDQTKRIAASLDKDVTLYLICNTGNEDTTVQRLLQRYADLSDHIKVEIMDPFVNPTFLDSYELDVSRLYENSVLVDCEGRYRLVGYDEIFVTSYDMDYYSYNYVTSTSFNGESVLTSAIHYVSSDDLPKVYTLTGHGETALDGRITEMLSQDNFESDSLSLLSEESVPEDAAAIIINAPSTDLSQDEADMLIAYLENGGSIALLTSYMDADAMPNLKQVTASMGLTTETGIIIEGERNMRLTRYPHYILPTIASHDITSALAEAGYYILTPLAQPLVETEDSSASITWLLTTSDSAYAKQAALSMTTTEKEDGDTDGPFNVAALSENGGKLFWVTSDTLLDSYVDSAVSGANSNLFMNALNYMCAQEESISIRAKSLDSETLTVPQSEATLWSVVMIGIIPVGLVILGMLIWIRRKRR